MSDKMRWRYGDTNPVVAAVDSAQVIEIGDLLYQDIDDAKPAGYVGMSNAKPEAAQAGFARLFLGISMQRSRSGDTASIRVATTGVFEFDCPSTAFELGDLIGVFSGPLRGDNGLPVLRLWNQQVVKVIDHKSAIGRVARREGSPTTSVLVDIQSTIMTGGIQGSYSIG